MNIEDHSTDCPIFNKKGWDCICDEDRPYLVAIRNEAVKLVRDCTAINFVQQIGEIGVAVNNYLGREKE